MKNENARFNGKLAWLVFASSIVFTVSVVLTVGLSLTPFECTDTAGRPMGFNEHFGFEHYVIMARHFDPAELLKAEYVYTWVLAGMHFAAGVLLSIKTSTQRLTRWFFAIQAAVFPFGIPALFVTPLFVYSILAGKMDREDFDLSIVLFIAQPIWVLTSLWIMIVLRAPGLGLATIWRKLVDAGRTGSRVVVEAMK